MFDIIDNGFNVIGKLGKEENGTADNGNADSILMHFHYDPGDSGYAPGYKYGDPGNSLFFSFASEKNKLLIEDLYPKSGAIWYDDFRRIVPCIKTGHKTLNLSKCTVNEVYDTLKKHKGRIKLRFDRNLMNPMNKLNAICGKCSEKCYALTVKNRGETVYVPVLWNEIKTVGEDILCLETRSDLWQYGSSLFSPDMCFKSPLSSFYGMDYFFMMNKYVDCEDAAKICPFADIDIFFSEESGVFLDLTALKGYICQGGFTTDYKKYGFDGTAKSVAIKEMHLPSAPGEDMEIFDRVDTDYKYPVEQYTEFVYTFMF